ncbi:unnamed protein product [Urochloa humidicola]
MRPSRRCVKNATPRSPTIRPWLPPKQRCQAPYDAELLSRPIAIRDVSGAGHTTNPQKPTSQPTLPKRPNAGNPHSPPVPHTHIAQQCPPDPPLPPCVHRRIAVLDALRGHAAMGSPSSALPVLPPRAPHPSSPPPPSLAPVPVTAPDTGTPANPPPLLRSPVVAAAARREAISEEERIKKIQ